MPPPIYLPNGLYQLPPRGSMVFDLNTGAGQDLLAVTNNTPNDGASYTISIDHGPLTQRTLDSGDVDNYSDADGTHYHLDNIGAITLEVDLG